MLISRNQTGITIPPLESNDLSVMKRGMTLIETLVTLSIIGILTTLILPAIQRVRESSRKTECVNRLKQIGVALANHQSNYQNYPSPMPARDFKIGTFWASPTGMSGYYELLPFLEQAVVYNTINLGVKSGKAIVNLEPRSPENSTVFATRMDNFICPSDSHAASIQTSPCSYRFNVGNSFPVNPPPSYKAGAFVPIRPSRPDQFTDGLSVTVGFSERLVGSQSSSRFFANRDIWGANLNGLIQVNTDQDVLDVCRSLKTSPSDFMTSFGKTWMEGGNTNLWYNHVATPNDLSSDCLIGSMNSSQPNYCESCSVSVRSNHMNGVNCLIMDGSVRFVTNGVVIEIWRALGTRDGNEILP